MRVIIAGSRDIYDYYLVETAIKESGFEITSVVSGCARGVDKSGEAYAEYRSIPVVRYPAKWDIHGYAAGPIRNSEMAKNADALIAVTNGSRGTADMIRKAKSAGLKVFVKQVEETTDDR